MSAKHALLGLLLERPAYPYQLANQLNERLGPAWKVNSGQLYQTIKGMEKDGLIVRVQEDAGAHEDRHVFQVTDSGVGEFERFFEQGPDPVRLCRRPLLVKITFAGPRRLEETLEKVDAYERECAHQLAETARLREELPGDGPLLRADQLLLRLNLSADVFQLEGELRWARHAREMLSWLAGREAVWPSERERAGAQPGESGREGEHRSRAEAERRGREGGSARQRLFKRMAGAEDAGTDRGETDGGGKDGSKR